MSGAYLDVFPLPRGAGGEGVGRVGGWNISSWFGGRANPFTGAPSWHGGEDIVCPADTPLYAPCSGWVSQAWDSGGGGNWTSIRTDSGLRIGLGHAHQFAPGVNGTHVEAGTLVALSDSTGASTGNHLHFALALSPGGPWADPFDALQDAAARGAFVGEDHPTPSEPMPDPGSIGPQHPPLSPKEALVTMQLWKIKGEDPIYSVDIADTLAGAKTADGQPATDQHLVGGVYVVQFESPAQFVLASGMGAAPFELDPADGDHAPLVDELRALPRVYQAA